MYNQISINKRRTFYMFAIFALLIIGLGWALSYMFNDQSILFIAVIISIIQSWVSYYYSDKIALMATGAKEPDRQKFLELHRLVENIAIAGGLPKPKIYVINDPSPNAFATGRDPKHASVAVTTGLLEVLDKTELEGVMAHEMAHVGNRDILVMTVAVTLVGIVVLISDIAFRANFWKNNDNSDSKAGGALMIVALVLVLLSPLFAQLIQLAVSRKREYMADATGSLLTRYPEGLARALEKIEKYERPMHSANRATAHLFINEPFGREEPKKHNWFSTVFSTHPPIPDRVKKLRQMA